MRFYTDEFPSEEDRIEIVQAQIEAVRDASAEMILALSLVKDDHPTAMLNRWFGWTPERYAQDIQDNLWFLMRGTYEYEDDSYDDYEPEVDDE